MFTTPVYYFDCNVHTFTCMVPKTPVLMHAHSPQKTLMRLFMCAYASAEASLPRNYCELILSLARASYRLSLPPAQLLSRLNPSTDAVRSRNPSKSTLAHDAVAAVVSHKFHSIIRVWAGPIQFVYKSHSRLAT